jgi:23S rRNA pseudouridine2457 synthase
VNRYFVLNKPFNMVSQFVSTHDVRLLGDLSFKFPEGTHAIGRLDKDSEGLLLLTTDKSITRKIFLGAQPHKRTYLVMVQNEVTNETLTRLQTGIPIKIKAGEMHLAVPESISIVNDPLSICDFATDRREIYPHTWMLITLTEGKYHQVRKMVLAVKHRCLRLIRLNMEGIDICGLSPGEVKEMHAELFMKSANI